MPEPWDPLKGAWILLLTMIGALFLLAVLQFVGCVFFHSEATCAKGEGLRDLGMEVLAAVLVLLAQRR